MSFYTYYQAIPERSRLLDRLRTERAFCNIYTRLITSGPGPFHLARLDPDELDDFLEDLAEDKIFGSRSEVDRCLNDLQGELAHAVEVYPGLDHRAAYIEKLHEEIDRALSAELKDRAAELDVKLMKDLLYGHRIDCLAPDFFAWHDSQLRLTPSPTVARMVKLLEGVHLSEESHHISDYACEQYSDWKGFLIEAAELGEAVIILPTS